MADTKDLTTSEAELTSDVETTQAENGMETLSDAVEEQNTESTGGKAAWYVVHTYSGYENKVKANLDKTIENRNLQAEILEVRVPMQDVVEMKNGTRKTVQKKMFPGYVLVNMVMNDDTWFVVRNTRGVTGFVGPGSKPVPLTEAEMKPLGIHTDNVNIDFAIGDTVIVVAGVWKDTVGAVQRIDENKQTATIVVEMFGRETPVEISFAEVRKLN